MGNFTAFCLVWLSEDFNVFNLVKNKDIVIQKAGWHCQSPQKWLCFEDM